MGWAPRQRSRCGQDWRGFDGRTSTPDQAEASPWRSWPTPPQGAKEPSQPTHSYPHQSTGRGRHVHRPTQKYPPIRRMESTRPQALRTDMHTLRRPSRHGPTTHPPNGSKRRPRTTTHRNKRNRPKPRPIRHKPPPVQPQPRRKNRVSTRPRKQTNTNKHHGKAHKHTHKAFFRHRRHHSRRPLTFVPPRDPRRGEYRRAAPRIPPGRMGTTQTGNGAPWPRCGVPRWAGCGVGI